MEYSKVDIVINNLESSSTEMMMMKKKKSSCCNVNSLLLQGDDHDIFFNKLLITRSDDDPSILGFSSRIYYRSTEGHVPFKWESQPGTPINPPDVHHLLNPPLTPPPAALHGSILAGRSSCTNYNRTSSKGTSSWSRAFFWKMKKQSKTSKRVTGESSPDITGMGRVENFEFWSSDSDSSSSSSSSLDGSSTPFQTMRSQKTAVNSNRKSRRVEGLDQSIVCSPWNFMGVAVCAPKGL